MESIATTSLQENQEINSSLKEYIFHFTLRIQPTGFREEESFLDTQYKKQLKYNLQRCCLKSMNKKGNILKKFLKRNFYGGIIQQIISPRVI